MTEAFPPIRSKSLSCPPTLTSWNNFSSFLFCDAAAAWLNKSRIHNSSVLIEIIDSKPSHVPLLTLSNHHSCFDDPGIWGKSRSIVKLWPVQYYFHSLIHFFHLFALRFRNRVTGILPIRQNCNYRKIRWSLAAHDICFTKKYHSRFFMHGKQRHNTHSVTHVCHWPAYE